MLLVFFHLTVLLNCFSLFNFLQKCRERKYIFAIRCKGHFHALQKVKYILFFYIFNFLFLGFESIFTIFFNPLGK